jgi:methyl-accepting chemotaxis protein
MTLSMRSRIFVGFGVVVLAMVTTGVVGWWYVSRLSADFESLYTGNLQASGAAQLQAAIERADTARKVLLGLSLAFGAGLIVFVNHAIARPLLNATTVLRAAASGDFTGRVAGRATDEIGRLAEDVNASIGTALQEVRQVADETVRRSQELAAAAEQL